MPDKLAVIEYFECGTINIQSYCPRTKSWELELDTRIRGNNIFQPTLFVIEGELFVTGGYEKRTLLKSVQCLNLHTYEWTDLPPMNIGRMYHELTGIKGYLCAIGGDSVFSIGIFNFSTRQWQDVVPPSGNSYFENAAADKNGILYFLDLCDGILETYDITSNSWTTKEIEKLDIFGFRLVVAKGFLYVIMGYKSDSRYEQLKTFRRYNLADGSWHELAPVPLVDGCHIKATALQNKIIIYYCRFAELYEYDIKKNKWNFLKNYERGNGACHMLNTWNLNYRLSGEF